MDFFKSVFVNDPEPSSNPQNRSDSVPNSPISSSQQPDPDQRPNPNPELDSSSAWSFGDLIKTIATRSESVIETYRRDLSEFRSGLKKETEVIRDVASRAVKDLPVSLETGASVAQESLESVGQAIDEFGSSVWRGTAEIISQGKDAILSVDQDSDSSSDPQNAASSASALNSKRYSRFEAQMLGIQSDLSTYCDEPEDSEDFEKWKLGFVLEEKAEEIENLFEENGVLEGIYEKLVPSVVDHETFWNRYFYRIYKLKIAEDARANLVKRAISREDDEDLSWEVEDDDEEVTTNVSKNQDLEKKEIAAVLETDAEKKPIEVAHVEMSEEDSNKGSDDMGFAAEPNSAHGSVGRLQLVEKNDLVAKSDEKMGLEGKAEAGESCKDSDVSVVSSQPSVHEEEDLGWDEIEDLGSIDEKKVTNAASPSKDYLRKRLSAADEDEDLSWDIEDEEPVKH